jgi:hypothetical protein
MELTVSKYSSKKLFSLHRQSQKILREPREIARSSGIRLMNTGILLDLFCRYKSLQE